MINLWTVTISWAWTGEAPQSANLVVVDEALAKKEFNRLIQLEKEDGEAFTDGVLKPEFMLVETEKSFTVWTEENPLCFTDIRIRKNEVIKVNKPDNILTCF